MNAQGLADLLTDGEERVERCHRLLEDHADLSAADPPQLRGRRPDELTGLEQD